MLTSDVVAYYRTRYRVAQALKDAGHEITERAVYAWGNRVPELRAYQLEEMTGGKLRRTRYPQRVA